MSPSPDLTRRSGEHRAGSDSSTVYVTEKQFLSFTDEFRAFAQTVMGRLDSVGEKLAEGSTRFSGLERDAREIKDQMKDINIRADDHSGRVAKLENANQVSDALRIQAAELAKPRRSIMEAVITALVIAIVLGIGAVLYNSWRDAALDERERERARERDGKNPAATVVTPTAPAKPSTPP